jgi:DNA-directed RNA polymerase subunit RPC12/RpoP
MSVPGKSFGLLPRHWVAGDADVVCPACRSRALFTQPYGYVPDLKDAEPRLPGVQWGGGFAVERFPDLFPWRDPDNPWEWEHGREKANWGVIACPRCGLRRKHLLDWPKEAFYRAESAAGLLWAYSREHLVQIRHYVAGDRTRRGQFDMNRVPKEFIQVRNRARVLKAIDRMLERPEAGGAGSSPKPTRSASRRGD